MDQLNDRTAEKQGPLIYFHILFQNIFKSDLHLAIWAENSDKAIARAKSGIAYHRADYTNLEVLTEDEFVQKFPAGIHFMFVAFKNGHGEKFCSVRTNSEEEAITIFQERYPEKDHTEILTHPVYILRLRAKMAESEEFEKNLSQKQLKRPKQPAEKPRPIKKNGITAAPYQTAFA